MSNLVDKIAPTIERHRRPSPPMTRLDTIERLCRSAVFSSVSRLQQRSGRPAWYTAHSGALPESSAARKSASLSCSNGTHRDGYRPHKKMYRAQIRDPLLASRRTNKPGIADGECRLFGAFSTLERAFGSG